MIIHLSLSNCLILNISKTLNVLMEFCPGLFWRFGFNFHTNSPKFIYKEHFVMICVQVCGKQRQGLAGTRKTDAVSINRND